MYNHNNFNPSWTAVDNWLKKEARKAHESERPYGYGDLTKFRKTPGIYAIYFPKTKEVYFGSTNNLYKRRLYHISDLRNGLHENNNLQKAFYDSQINLIMFFYKATSNTQEALELEQKFLDDYSGNPKLLNTAKFIKNNYPKTFEKDYSVTPEDLHRIRNKHHLGLTMSTTLNNDTDALQATTAPCTSKGIIFYSDGACRPTNPGNIGWGVHGYLYENEEPKKGAGHPTHILTTSGYVPKVAKVKEGYKEVKVIKYFDFFGSSLDQQSNNVAELEATRNALERSIDHDVKTVTIYTDSEYVRRGVEEWSPTWIRRNWIKSDGQPVPNAEYWKKLINALNALIEKGVEVSIKWVKGHSNVLGNEIADKLATIGAMYSIRRAVRGEFKTSPPEGYWKITSEKHPFISSKRMYFNTIASSQVPGEYYLGDHGRDDDLLGKKISDGSYSIIQLETPDPILEKLRSYQTDIAYDIDSIIIARIDKIYSPETYQEIIDYEEGAFVRANAYSLDINCLDGKPLTKELRPARLAMRAIEALTYLKEKLNIFKLEESTPSINNTNLLNFKSQDITDIFYEKEIKIKKKVEETSLKLKAKYNVGFSALQVKTNIIKDGKEHEISLTLTLGIDLPERNGLKRLEELNPSFHLITWNEGPNSIRYAVIAKSENNYGIWAGVYSNLVFIK